MKTRQGLFLGVLGTVLIAASGASADSMLTGSTTADNAFFAYVSSSNATLGTLIGSGNSWSSSFPVASASLSPGTYYLQVEAINYGGPAGFSGVFNLSGGGNFLNNTSMLTTDPSNIADWLGIYNNSNSAVTAQPWLTPTGTVYQDTSYPWGNVVGTANWIWPNDPAANVVGAGPCQFCTVDFSAQFTVPGSTTIPEPLTLSLFGAGLAGAIAMRRRKTKA